MKSIGNAKAENGRQKTKNTERRFCILHLACRVVFLCISAAVFSSCKTQKTDMRAFVPNDALIYLEIEDLGKTLRALTENKAWASLAKEKTDFSPLENIQIAVAVEGFETSEKQVTNDASILNFKPRFVAVADTHEWKWATISIAENQIGKFVKSAYGDDVKLEKSSKDDAEFFVWTGGDGRKFFAAVMGGFIYAGNDEDALNKCLAVKKGTAASLLKNENLAGAREKYAAENNLAFGYVSPEGIAQIADFAGVASAVNSSEENLTRQFIAKILPDILRKTAREIVWTARKNEAGIEDGIFVKSDAETASIFKETLAPKTENQTSAAEFLPLSVESTTLYNLQNPQIAWRSVLFVAAKQTDAAGARILSRFSNLPFEPYGIADGEEFLSAVESPILTARFDEDGEKSVVVTQIKNIEQLKKSLIKEINFKSAPGKIGTAEVWQAADEDLAAAISQNNLILGEKQSVSDCLNAKETGQNFAKTAQFQRVAQSSAIAASVTKDTDSAQKIVALLGGEKEANKKYAAFYTTETRLNGESFERRSVSDFGLIGMILEQFAGK